MYYTLFKRIFPDRYYMILDLGYKWTRLRYAYDCISLLKTLYSYINLIEVAS